MNRRVILHRILSLIWLASLVPALLWWKESIMFVIVASVYANVVGEWSAAEASDDRVVLKKIGKLEGKVDEL